MPLDAKEERDLTDRILRRVKNREAYAKHAQEHRSGGFDPLLELGSAPGNPGKEYDFWVCSSGGTHTTLFGTGGALTAAWTYNKNFVTIYVCSGHTESVAAAYSFSTAPLFNTLSIISLGQNPAQVQVGPLFTLGAGITSFFDRTYTTANPIDSLTFTNINFSSNGQAGCSIFTGSRPVGNYTDFFNCSLIQIDYPFNVTNMISDTAVTFSNSFLSAYTTPSAIIKQTGTDVSSGTIPAAYQTGLYLIECDVELYDTLIGGVGCGIKFLQNIVVHNSNLLLSSHTTDLSWLDLKIGGAYNVGDTGTYAAGMTRHPHIRVTDNRIVWAVATGRTAPFMASTTASGTFLIGHLTCIGNTVSIVNGTAALAGTFFANMGGTAGPHNINITGNSIALDTNTGTGTAITLGANALNCRVDNVYRGFATNVSGTVGSGIGLSYATVVNETGTEPNSGYLFGGNNAYVDDDRVSSSAIVLSSWKKGADVASATALVLPATADYFHITGTTTITSIDMSAGGGLWATGYRLLLEFTGALLLTHHATNLILQGGVNYTTAAGDVLEFVAESAGGTQWREISRSAAALSGLYLKRDGTTPLTGKWDQSGAFDIVQRGGDLLIANSKDLLLYSDDSATPSTQKGQWDAATGHIGVGTAINTGYGLNLDISVATGNARGISALIASTAASSSTLAGLLFKATASGATGISQAILAGLYGGVVHDSSKPTVDMYGGYFDMLSTASGSGAITRATGLIVTIGSGGWASDVPATTYGLRITDIGGAGATAYGLHIATQTGTNVRSFIADPLVLGGSDRAKTAQLDLAGDIRLDGIAASGTPASDDIVIYNETGTDLLKAKDDNGAAYALTHLHTYTLTIDGSVTNQKSGTRMPQAGVITNVTSKTDDGITIGATPWVGNIYKVPVADIDTDGGTTTIFTTAPTITNPHMAQNYGAPDLTTTFAAGDWLYAATTQAGTNATMIAMAVTVRFT